MATTIQSSKAEKSTTGSERSGSLKSDGRKTRKRRSIKGRRKDGMLLSANQLPNANRLISRSRDALAQAYDWAGNTASSLPNLRQSIDRSRLSNVNAMMHDNPALIGAVGFGLGVVLGALFPMNVTPSRSRYH